MQNAYVNAKLVADQGSLYVFGNMYQWQGKFGGYIQIGHMIPSGEADKMIMISPPDSVLVMGGPTLRVASGDDWITIDWKGHTVSWESPAWSGSAPFEWSSTIITNDDGTVTNLAYP